MGVDTGTCIGIGADTGIGIGTSDQDVDYRLTTHVLVRFRDTIYVSNCIDLKKLILREFHVKPYSIHPGY